MQALRVRHIQDTKMKRVELEMKRVKEEADKAYLFYYQTQFSKEDVIALLTHRKTEIINRFTEVPYTLSGSESGSVLLCKEYCNCNPMGWNCGHGPKTTCMVPLTMGFIEWMLNQPDGIECFEYTLKMKENKTAILHLDTDTLPFELFKRYYLEFNPQGLELKRDIVLTFTQV
jgi:hypothetical protein